MKNLKLVLLTLVQLVFLATSARGHYDPNVGRWLSRDPIAENGGLNLYCFVQNKPISAVDLLGKKLIVHAPIPDTNVTNDKLVGVEGSSTSLWNGISHTPRSGIEFRWVKVMITKSADDSDGVLTVDNLYKTGDDYDKAHEEHHAIVNIKWWNEAANEVNWTETKWCRPCFDLVVTRNNANIGWKSAEADLENAKYDQTEYRSRGVAANIIAAKDADVITKETAKVAAKAAYDTAQAAFVAKCGAGTGMNK